ncbi:Hypothetical protein FKW44_008450 [Caligus rogercresseyi]|uniref:Uncharacterized protein n=1 Tax=Caligus rogercresseyi TaxID=217165 RepID=A0A7T8KG51_CALRO|nr:Hypothetical protein FKW44_008450 [Caligus rogercresseyi]
MENGRDVSNLNRGFRHDQELFKRKEGQLDLSYPEGQNGSGIVQVPHSGRKGT